MSLIQQMRDKWARKRALREFKAEDAQLESDGCVKDPETGMWMDPVSGLPIGTVIRNHKGEYGVVVSKDTICSPLTKQECEYIIGGPLPTEFKELRELKPL